MSITPRLPEDCAWFSRAMGNMSALAAQGTVQQDDLSQARYIVDVGGVDGSVLLVILDAHPHVRGTAFDQPHVVDAARQAIHAKHHQARCEALGGDFFQAVPLGGDPYVLKFICAGRPRSGSQPAWRHLTCAPPRRAHPPLLTWKGAVGGGHQSGGPKDLGRLQTEVERQSEKWPVPLIAAVKV